MSSINETPTIAQQEAPAHKESTSELMEVDTTSEQKCVSGLAESRYAPKAAEQGTVSGEERRKHTRAVAERLISKYEQKAWDLMIAVDEATDKDDHEVAKTLGKEVDDANDQLARFRTLLAAAQEPIPTNTNGTAINLRDIPLFQLAGHSVPNPDAKVYQHVELYLSAFENVLATGKEHIDIAWSKWLPNAMVDEYDAWYKSTLALKNCKWEEARVLIKQHYDSEEQQAIMSVKALTMTMREDESVQEYGHRFQRTCREGNVKQDMIVALRFLASLTPHFHQTTHVAWWTRNSHKPQTVQQVLDLAITLTRPMKRVRAEAEKTHTGSRRRTDGQSFQFGSSRHRSGKASGSPASAGFFCTQHGKNTTHNTEGCRIISGRAEKAKAKECYHCHRQWSPGHTCPEYHTSFVNKQRKPNVAVHAVRTSRGSMVDKLSEELEYTSLE
ncbi:hypothetical protein INT47_009691 [Mucor saturninus]|uniref:Retrotransposon gag domain-containing protein n=1 Tax=Mucor saturninus TaxID=64648 RepID=A0A8H7QFB8_9FUNG|nr:hypothetical protein INT47_009691 [Mucor saturninus]